MEEKLPAILWNENELEYLNGSFLKDRITSDLEILYNIQKDTNEKYPQIQVFKEICFFFLTIF